MLRLPHTARKQLVGCTIAFGLPHGIVMNLCHSATLALAYNTLTSHMQSDVFRLFLLEDDENDAFMIQRAIDRSGIPCKWTRFYEPTAAIEALTNAQRPGEVPHLILTDLKMPRMSGLDFIKWLRQSRFSYLPIIMLSGSSLPEDILAAYRSGTNSFSTKPLNVHDLDEIVRTVLKYWKDICQTPTSVLQTASHLCDK